MGQANRSVNTREDYYLLSHVTPAFTFYLRLGQGNYVFLTVCRTLSTKNANAELLELREMEPVSLAINN